MISIQENFASYCSSLSERRDSMTAASTDPTSFYLPLARSACQVKLTFSNSDSKQIIAIEPGPAFDPARWEKVVEEIERTGPLKRFIRLERILFGGVQGS